MMNRIFAPAIAAALVFAFGCADSDSEPELNARSVEIEIEAVNARFESFIAGQQWDSLSSIYTADAVVMPQGAPMAQGADAIRDGFAPLGRMGITSFDLETIEVERAGDTASEIGRYSLRSGNGAEVDQGKYLTVWKEVGDNWKIHRCMFNSDSQMQVGGLSSGRTETTPRDATEPMSRDTMGTNREVPVGRMPADTTGPTQADTMERMP